jgi:hypothetical protein
MEPGSVRQLRDKYEGLIASQNSSRTRVAEDVPPEGAGDVQPEGAGDVQPEGAEAVQPKGAGDDVAGLLDESEEYLTDLVSPSKDPSDMVKVRRELDRFNLNVLGRRKVRCRRMACGNDILWASGL